MSLATDLTLGIHNWFNKPGVDKAAFAGTQLWPKFVEAGNETSRPEPQNDGIPKIIVTKKPAFVEGAS
eukprot:g4513.t1